MIIRVTREDIKKAKRDGVKNCPIALAVERHTDQPALVYGGVILTGTYMQGTCDNQPRSVLRFIARFDGGKPVKPFNFILKSF